MHLKRGFHQNTQKTVRALVIVVLVAVVSVLYWQEEAIRAHLFFLGELKEVYPFISAALLVLLKAIAAPLGFPGTPLTLLVGGLYGVYWGTLIALIGNTLGAALAFLLARFLFQDFVSQKFLTAYPRIKQLEMRLCKKPIATTIALRLIPLFPFNALNFMLGVTALPFRSYVFASFIGMIPGTFAFVYLGESLAALSVVHILSSIVGIAALVYVGAWYEKRF